MEKHIFKIDDKNPLYKKLIKLPTAYYIVKENGNVNRLLSKFMKGALYCE